MGLVKLEFIYIQYLFDANFFPTYPIFNISKLLSWISQISVKLQIICHSWTDVSVQFQYFWRYILYMKYFL